MTGPAVLLCLFLSSPANLPVDSTLSTEWYCHDVYEVMVPDSVDFKQLMDDAILTDVIVAPFLYVSLRFETTDAHYRRIHVYFMNLERPGSEYLGLEAETAAMLEGVTYDRATIRRSLWIAKNFTFDFNDGIFTLHRLTFGQVFYAWPRLVHYVDLRHEANELSEKR